MRSEALDIILETRGDSLWLILTGPFNNEQIPNIREKIAGLIEDGNRSLIIDLEGVDEIDTNAVPMFLQVVSLMRGKGGLIRFIFRNQIVTNAFSVYRNLFTIYPDAQTLATGGFFNSLKRQGRVLFRKTGVRISPAVALVLLFVLLGWFVSLMFIIRLQGHRIKEQSTEIQQLTTWKDQAGREIEFLSDRIRPMEQLGLLPDSLPKKK